MKITNDMLKQGITEALNEVALNEIALVRRIRNGKIVKKAAIRRKGFKVVRNKSGGAVLKKMSAIEMLKRRKSATKAWRKGKSVRLRKAKRSMVKSRRKMRILYH